MLRSIRHLEEYKFLKSKDLTKYNPRIILETEEKAECRIKAIPLPIQFIQHDIEEYQLPGHSSNSTWEYKHEFRYEDLYQVFFEYKQCSGVLKPIPLHTFRESISKKMKPEVGCGTREGGSKRRYYTFGNNPQQVIG